ncbi:hypothetical protein CLOM_g6696 [Closterium sp. NIES-68]|nr:hypothetical protein CLOM_g6696 [Closterium sp. NIES-68]GJP80659.1 hypothetical protein CLOP_g10860 [Closterium sp. NIES-67]
MFAARPVPLFGDLNSRHFRAALCLVLSAALCAPTCALRALGAAGGAPPAVAAPSISAALSGASSAAQSFRVSLLVLNATGLLAKLPALAPLTLFAPTDAAWRAAFHALALSYIQDEIPRPPPVALGVSPGGSANASDTISLPTSTSGDAAAAAAAGGPPGGAASGSDGASVAMVPASGVPEADLSPSGANIFLPGGPNLTTSRFDELDIFPVSRNTSIDPLRLDPLLAALSAVFAGDGSPASLAALAKERPEALKALADLLAFHVATAAALNAAAIAAQYAEVPDNLTTLNGQGLWINYNASEKATQFCAYSPAQRALMDTAEAVGVRGTLYYPNGTTVDANGTVNFDGARGAGKVDANQNLYYPNGTITTANGTVIWAMSVLAGNFSTLSPASSSTASNRSASVQMVDAIDPLPLPQVDRVPGDNMGAEMGGGVKLGARGSMVWSGLRGGMGASWGNLSTEVQRWWGWMGEWAAQRVPGMNMSGGDFFAWVKGPSYGWGSDCATRTEAGSDMNVAQVVRADVMDSDGVVVHGVDGVLFPHFRDLPGFNGSSGGIPLPFGVVFIVPNASLCGGGHGTVKGTAGGASDGQSNGEAGGAGGSAGASSAGAVAGGSNSSSSSMESEGRGTASGLPAATAGSPPASGSQIKAAAAGWSPGALTFSAYILAVAFTIVAVV